MDEEGIRQESSGPKLNEDGTQRLSLRISGGLQTKYPVLPDGVFCFETIPIRFGGLSLCFRRPDRSLHGNGLNLLNLLIDKGLHLGNMFCF